MSRLSLLDAAASLVGSEITRVAAWTGKEIKGSKRVFAYFDAADERWVLKGSVGPDPLLRVEQNALVELNARFAGTPLEGTIPTGLHASGEILVMPMLAGTPLRDVAQRARRDRSARPELRSGCLRTMDWMSAFHRITGTRPGAGGTHGDLKPSNVLVGRAVQVIDWELYERDGVQTDDVMHFLLSLGLFLGGPNRSAGIDLILFEHNWIADLGSACLERYGYSADRDLRQDLRTYAAARLERRTALGLDNRDHFLAQLLTTLSNVRRASGRLPLERA